MNNDFLVELGCEELPPKALKTLAEHFLGGIEKSLRDAGFTFGKAQYFAAPRRLTVFIEQLLTQQPDRETVLEGPAVSAAFGADGNPTPAAQGFAKKCGVDISALDKSGAKLRFVKKEAGKSTTELLPTFVEQSLANLPIPKRMRWAASRIEFVRPTQWLVMLLGDEVIDCEILGQKAGRLSRGHRFHHDDVVRISKPSTYLEDLRSAYVIADFAERRTTIIEKTQALAKQEQGTALMPDSLIDEVAALIEWPVPLVCSFEERFLAVPQEALISTMQDNQKYFCLVDSNGKLKNRFITVANIESSAPEKIIAGNEKVVRPRLTDAEFFFKQDKKATIEDRQHRLGNVIFQKELGTVLEKSYRIGAIAGHLAKQVDANSEFARHAGIISKNDLASELVGEFPELQGIAGYYYALNENLDEEIALAMREQYQPRFAGDNLPSTATGACVSVADKLDTLVGIFGINQPPTGSKDPFALRRAAIGLLRILIEKEFDIGLYQLIGFAINQYQFDEKVNPSAPQFLAAELLRQEVFNFLLSRYRAMYEEQGIKPEVILAVQALNPDSPLDFDRRVKAVNAFTQLPEAAALSAANKRVSNILAKDSVDVSSNVDNSLLQEPAEKALAEQVAKLQTELAPLFAAGDYQTGLSKLASLRETVDAFFDGVMVNAEDPALRKNRLTLLAQLRALFLAVADISLLA